MLKARILEYGGVPVSPMELYSDIFQFDKGYLQNFNDEKGGFKSNPIGYGKNNDSTTGDYRILFQDSFEEELHRLQEYDFAIMNGLTYFGRKNLQDRASKMFAMIFDLDYVDSSTLNNFLHAAFSKFKHYPVPNYIALSGHGLHLYYVFEEPVDLYPNRKLRMKELKYELTGAIWNRYTSHEKHPQYQGINQGFRVIGGKTKIDGVRVEAFKLDVPKYTIDSLSKFVFKTFKDELYKPTKFKLKEVALKFPEWYEEVVIKKQKKSGTWMCKRDLYRWWLGEIKEKTRAGHRYFAIMCLAIYAVKCGVDYEELKRDCYNLIDTFTAIKPEEPFFASDVESALECFDIKYATFPLKDIIKISGIAVEKNKRNGRNQQLHLRLARGNLAILNEDRGISLQGRPSSAKIVESWRRMNPEGRKVDCQRETKLDPKTIRKWW